MNEKSNGYIDFLCSLFNQYLFNEAKNSIDQLKYYFAYNPATSGNYLAQEMLNAIESYGFENIDIPLFKSIIVRTGKTEKEGAEILGKIIEYKNYTKDQIAPMRKYLRDCVASTILRKGENLFKDSPSEFINYLKDTNFRSTDTDYLVSTSFNTLDINSLVADSGDPGIKSSFSWINNCFKPKYAYDRGQICSIILPPGRGKSLLAVNEALYMARCGHKVHMLNMGDLCIRDQLIRMAAIYSGMSFWDARQNLGTIYGAMKKEIGDNLELTIAPAGKITSKEYVEFVKKKKYDVVFIDYDSNFKVDGLSDKGSTMYNVWGDIYEELTELSGMGILVFVLAQPKVQSWNDEIIPLSSLGESSRKAHTVDFVWTSGTVQDCPYPLGIACIVKNRRGEVGVRDYQLRLNNGRFKSLPKGIYDSLKGCIEKRDFTEAELDVMIEKYNKTRSEVDPYAGLKLPGSGQGFNPSPAPRGTNFGPSNGGKSF